ncbi:MAG: family 1 glycosylhydrolase [Pseudomonadota bacterium]
MATLFLLFKLTLSLLGLGALAWGALCLWLHLRYPEPHWDWSSIDVDRVRFPREFLWGVATAAHQVEGGNTNNNWAWWETQVDERGLPRIAGGQEAGDACDSWNRYEEDIELAQRLGVKGFRLSLEWSRIEPEEGVFDEEAIAHYHRVLEALERAGMEPMLTLLHFTWPMWFEQQGAFERSSNIPVFLRFCERVFSEYRPRCRLWCTINEPEVVSLIGYLLGMFPPGRRDLGSAARVQRNLLLAHAQVYHRLKALPGGADAEIGLVKNIFQLDPSRRWLLPEWILARLADHAHNEAILEYLRTGTFRWRIPYFAWLTSHDPEVKGAGDFFGLNFYSHVNVHLQWSRAEPVIFKARPHELPTDFHYPVYAEGFHGALQRAAALGKPLYVTENGVPDATDRVRDTWIRRYLYALHKALQEGLDIRGYFYWSLMDNFEWAEGYDQRFGLYHVDFATQKRTLREGSRAFERVVREKSDAPV